MAERLYNEQELADILRAAGVLQAAEADADTSPAGLRLAEIQRIAGEVGIEAKHVAAAASMLSADTARGRRLGPARRIVRERIVSGALDDDAWAEVVAELRERFGTTGAVSAVGATREWAAEKHFSALHFSATRVAGHTRIRIACRQFDGILVTWMLATVAALVTGLILVAQVGGHALTPLWALAWWLLFVTASLAAGSGILARWQSRNVRAIEETVDQVELTLAERSETPMNLATTEHETDGLSPIRAS